MILFVLGSYRCSSSLRRCYYVFIEIKKDENGDIWNEPTEALQKLYVQYGVYDSTAGIITSSSSGGSSASSALPKSVSEGDLETSWLMSTPYGVQAEMYFEQMNGIII